MSHPVWVRGLKPKVKNHVSRNAFVAPRVGAWIETDFALPEYDKLGLSHPVWVRGLKHAIIKVDGQDATSRTPCGCVD